MSDLEKIVVLLDKMSTQLKSINDQLIILNSKNAESLQNSKEATIKADNLMHNLMDGSMLNQLKSMLGDNAK